jgi:hypothetical protein
MYEPAWNVAVRARQLQRVSRIERSVIAANGQAFYKPPLPSQPILLRAVSPILRGMNRWEFSETE